MSSAPTAQPANLKNAADFISQRSLQVDSSGIRKVFDLAAKLKDPINFSIGLPDFDVPDIAKQAAISAIQTGHNRYTQTQGIAPLREKLRSSFAAEFGRDLGEVLITSGVSGGLFLAILATINPGDELICLDPYFVYYKHMTVMAGGTPVAVDSYPDFRFNADRVEKAITPKTKILLLNSPSNPTGIVMTQAEVDAAVGLARKYNLLIVSDEIYEPFLYDRTRLNSSAKRNALPSPAHHYENTLVLRGFSKSHAMTGWRLGYATGPAAIIAEMAKLQQYTYVCAPSPLQFAALAAMDVSMEKAVATYEVKRDLALSLLSQKFEIEKPEGAFYLFVKAPAGETGTSFVEKAIENNVLVIPGKVFSDQDTHFRISYATTDDKIRQGCAILNSLV